jgi:hypothetical protein
VTDSRVGPSIPTARIVKALFLTVLLRLGSVNAIDTALGKMGVAARRWITWIGGLLPSPDRLEEVPAQMEAACFRDILHHHYTRRARSKTLPPLFGKHRLLIFDGHEYAASYLRRCGDCLTREVKFKDGPRTQYYHRYVMAYLACEGSRILLDVEMQRKGEGEIAAARRLFERIVERYPRAFSVVAGDALYMDPDLCQAVVKRNKDFLVVLKNEDRLLIQDLRSLMPFEEPRELLFRKRRCECNDIEGFNSWPQFGQDVRVLRSYETWEVERQASEETDQLDEEWMWATTLTKDVASTAELLQMGHSRWDIENHGFNELCNTWHADHVYHHEVTAMTVMLLILFLAYNLFHVWQARGIKPALRARYTLKALIQILLAEFYRAHGRARAPT